MKKSLGYFSRGLVTGFELFGVAVLVALLLWCALMFRLSQGPLRADFLVSRVEASLNERQSGFAFDVDEAWLIWGGYFEPFKIEIKNLNIRRTGGAGVLKVQKVGIGLSKRGLLQLRLQPKEISIYAPSFRLLHDKDGRFGLDVGTDFQDTAMGPPMSQDMQKTRNMSIVRDLLAQVKAGSETQGQAGGDLSRLKQIMMMDASVYYDDRILDVVWKSKKTDIILSRGNNGIAGVADLIIQGEQGRRISVRANAFYDWEKQDTQVLVAFSGLAFADMAQASTLLKPLSDVNMDWRGSFAFELGSDFIARRTRFILASGAGSINFPLQEKNLYAAPLIVNSVYISGQSEQFVSIDKFNVDLGIAQLQASGKINKAENGYVFETSAQLLGMPIDSLPQYWPEALTPLPRNWVVSHLSKGTAQKATLDIVFDYQPEAANKITLQKLNGAIDFSGIDVDYFPPLAPVTDVSGRATYNTQSFKLSLNGGTLQDMKVGKTQINIDDLHKQTETVHSEIDIQTQLTGPLRTALKVLDTPPLGYPKKMGIDLSRKNSIGGNADIKLKISFPLYKNLKVSEVSVKANARIDDALLGGVVKSYDLKGGPLDLNVDNKTINVKGSAMFDGQPVTFDWQKNFASSSKEAMLLKAELPLSSAMLTAFGVPEEFAVTGSAVTQVRYTRRHDQTSSLSLQSDLTPLGYKIDALNYVKESGVKGSFSGDVQFVDEKVKSLGPFSVTVAGETANGQVAFLPSGEWSSAQFSRINFGASDITLKADNKGAAGIEARISGNVLDLARFFNDKRSPAEKADELSKPVAPLKIWLDVKKLATGEEFALSNAKAFIQRNAWQRLEKMELDAQAGGKPVTLRFGPQGKGYGLKFEAQNAGPALAVLGVTKTVRSGHLVVNAVPLASGGVRDMTGTALLTKFSLRDTPVIAKLLNALSLPGLISLLNGEGISFDKARVNFTWLDRSMPNDKENQRIIGLKDGGTSGSSLGLAFEGRIDLWNNVYDLDGTIIPISDFSKLISKIPLLGDILTAGGEGFIAATYKVKGPMDKPEVTVNPLSVLAPGILRKIFFEN